MKHLRLLLLFAVILVAGCSYSLPETEVAMLQEACANNGGVRYYNANPISHSEATCRNGAHFELVWRQRWNGPGQLQIYGAGQ